MSNYFTRLREAREAREARAAATLGHCPACGERLEIVRAAGDLRCRRCRCPLLVVADREAPREVVFRALTAGSKARRGSAEAWILGALRCPGNQK